MLLGILMLLSWFLAAHIRRQMMGMEPKQIARVVRQQEALFSSVYEGLIAVDPRVRLPPSIVTQERCWAEFPWTAMVG